MLCFLFTEINYGGRVTDDKDRRLINNLIHTFCAPQVLQEGAPFSPSGTYAVPAAETAAQVRVLVCLCACMRASDASVGIRRQRRSSVHGIPAAVTGLTQRPAWARCRAAALLLQFVGVIRGYPLVPAPEIFGLHENADITCQQAESYALLGTMLGLQPRSGGGSGGAGSREDVVGSTAQHILGQVCAFACARMGLLQPQAYQAAHPCRAPALPPSPPPLNSAAGTV